MLYLIPFLHQTTTGRHLVMISWLLYLIPFLHQTTTKNTASLCVCSCILFHFYIKPQLILPYYPDFHVVSYSISTSNHNHRDGSSARRKVVSYSISTSNHNREAQIAQIAKLYLIPFLHQTTTPLANLLPKL